MMERIKTMLGLLTIISVMGIGTIGYAQPKIPRENIPSDIPDDVRKEIEALYSSSPAARAKAAVNLSKLGARAVPAVPFLIEMVGDDSQLMAGDTQISIGEVAANVLTTIAEPAVKPLISALKHKEGRVRGTAAWALGEIGDSRAIEPLISAFKDKDQDVAETAIGALANIGKSAVEPLITALRDKDTLVRVHAAKALGEIKDTRGVEPLVAALKDKDWGVRINAAWALGKMKDNRAIEPLIAALKAEDSPVAASVAQALAMINGPRVVEPLIAILGDDSLGNRRAHAAWALGEMKDNRAIEPLIAALNSENMHVRENAAKALRKITGKDFDYDPVEWQKWWEENKAKGSVK